MACETEARPRLLLDGNEGFLRALSSEPPVPLELSQEDFSRTLAYIQLVNLRAHSLAQWHTGGMAIWGGGYPK